MAEIGAESVEIVEHGAEAGGDGQEECAAAVPED